MLFGLALQVWIPMRPISGTEEDSGLQFAEGSHRDFALPFWWEDGEEGCRHDESDCLGLALNLQCPPGERGRGGREGASMLSQ